jgi:hypothetical protein
MVDGRNCVLGLGFYAAGEIHNQKKAGLMRDWQLSGPIVEK